MRRREAALALVGVSAATLALSGCTVVAGAVAGIGVDEQGNPVGYVQVCTGHIDGATLYVPDTREDVGGTWEAPEPVTTSAAWSLTAPDGAGWGTTEPLEPLDPDATYILYGWTDDNTSSAAGEGFTVEDLAALRPGQVRYSARTGKGEDETWAETVVSVEDFEREACDSIDSLPGAG